MATSNSNDVPLTLSVTTIGKESIKELASEVGALAKQGGAAAPEFEKLANEIDKLATQSSVVENMRTLVTEIERLAVVEKSASAKAQELSTELQQLAAATTASTAVERDAKQALLASQQALFDKRQALATLKNETSASEKESNRYTQSVRTLNAEIIKGKSDVRELGAAYRESKAATSEAEVAERTLGKSLRESTNEANAAKNALKARNESLREARASLAEAGIATRDVATAEVALAKNYIETVSAIDRVRVARDKAAADALAIAAAEKAAAEKKKQDTIAYANLVDVLNAKITASNRSAADSARATAEASAKAGRELADAFGTVGVRSVQQVQAEIVRVRAAFDLLKATGSLTGAELSSAFGKSEAKVKLLEREVRELNGTLTLGDKTAKLFAGSMGQIAAGNLVANGVAMIAQKVTDLGRAFIDAIIQGDQLRRGLNAIYKDSDLAGRQLDFLRKASGEAGVSVGGLSKEFIKFSASMKSANIPVEQSNNLFKSLITTSASLGLSSDDTAGSLNALGQMASKGVVSLEELRAQLGDRLPGALGLTAKGMGITEQQLIKLVESGNLATRDFIVPFTNGLKTLQGETDGLVPTFERFKNLLTETAQGTGEAGGIVLLTGVIKGLGLVVGSVAMGLSFLAEQALLVGSAVVALAARVTGDAKAWDFYGEQVEKSRVRLISQALALQNFMNPAKKAADAVTALGTANTTTAAEQAAAEAAAQKLTTTTGLSSVAADLASNANLNLAENIIKYQDAAITAVTAQERVTEGLQKSAAAAKQQGDEMITIAKLSGDAIQIRKAEADAADLVAAALDAVTKSQKAEVDLLLIQRSHIIEVATARGDNKAAIDAQTAAVDKKLAKGVPELEQMQKTADAAHAEATARNLASEALKDNSANLEKYNVDVIAATSKVIALQEAEATGKDVKVELKAAQEELAKATFLYNDALKDSIDKIQMETRAKSANYQLSIATSAASQSHYELLSKEARARGDVTTAVTYEVRAKEAAITQLRLKLELDRLQNAAAVLEIETAQKLVDATTDAGKAKLKTLDIELQILKIKAISSEAIKDQIRSLELESNAIRNGTNARSTGSGGISNDTRLRTENAGAINQQTSALVALSAAQDRFSRPTSSYDKKDSDNPFGLTSDGLRANKDGSASGTFGSTTANQGLYDLAEKQRKGTLSAGDLEKAKAALEQAKFGLEWIRAMSSASAGSVSTIAQSSAQAAVNQAKAILGTVEGGIQTNGTGTPGSSGGQGSYTVNVNVGGASQAIKVASQQDAENLTRTIQQIGLAATRSS